MFLAMSLRAAPPFVSMANPPNDAVVNIGDDVYLRARVGDSDPGGQVTQVDYYTNGVLLGTATAAPWAVWWRNAMGVNVEVRAVATDIAMERGTSFVVRVTAEPARVRNLMWASSTSLPGEAQWNTRDFKWFESAVGGRSTLFHPGDSVTIYSWDPVFIGVDGVPMPVSPSAISSWTAMMLHGGDILTGSLAPNSVAVLTNYAGSLSFPGGTVLRTPGALNLTFNIARAPQGASVHLGTGPITVMDSRFNFDLVTNQFATLENDFYFEQQNSPPVLQPAAFGMHNATAKFTGALNLNAYVTVMLGSGTRGFAREGERDADYHEWAGPIILNQTRNAQIGLSVQGQGRSKGLLLSGGIKDGGGTWTNRLTLRGSATPVIRVSGSNTYARGTLIDLPQVGGPPCWVEVAPESSLGFGDVEVRGTLRLMGNGNIHSNATVRLTQGRVIIDSGVKVRVNRLAIFGETYAAGVFSSTNSFNRITSNGTIRVPTVNLQPSVAMASPANGGLLNWANAVELRATPSDRDSYIERVEFYVDGSRAGTRMTAPFSLSISNMAAGGHTVYAMVYDDDGGVGSSAEVTFTVAPGIDAIRYVETNVVAVEFRTAAGQSVELEASDWLAPTMWSTMGSFSGAAEMVSHVVTNAIPAGVTTRYFRLRIE